MRRALTLTALLLAACSGGGSVVKMSGEQLCGSTALYGEPADPIKSSTRGCGLEDGVRVQFVAGVRLSRPATLDCKTAEALETWVSDAVKPTIGRRGGGVEELTVFASYACRPRNNQRGARISEHGKGRAIDIGGFVLADGQALTVLSGWKKKADKKILKSLHSSACGTFGTVLGPEANRYHANHFHFDTARYRSGAYCR